MSDTTPIYPNTYRKFVGWTALMVPLLGWANIVLFSLLQGGDLELIFRPADALALPASAQSMFLASMVLDSFGFYLAFLAIGGYLWNMLRPQFGAAIDMATLALLIYILLGITGAMIPAIVLPELSALHAQGDPVRQAAAEASWLTLIYACHHALWGLEGPVMAIWGWVIGRSLQRSGARFGGILMLAGILYALFFAGLVLSLTAVQELAILAAVIVLPIWALLFGIQLLRQPDAH